MRDRFLREVVGNALHGIADEVSVLSARSAYSPFVNEMPQIACALFDKDARLIAQAAGGQSHLSAVHNMLREALKDLPPETLNDGDTIVFNDHFRGGIHPTDVATFRPIYCNGKLAFFHGAMMIVSDLGGLSTGGLPANATEIFHEGLIIPPVKLYERGEVNESVHRMIAANSRTPARVLGDIRALAAGGKMASVQLEKLTDKYGYEVLMAIVEELLDHSEQLVRAAIERIPDGVYTGSYLSEEDGIVENKTYTVQVAISVKGSDITLDFTGSAPQARGAINSSYSQTLSGTVTALTCYMGGPVPVNEGFYRPIKVVAPLGSILNPKYPAACNLRIASVSALVDSIIQALSRAFPNNVVAPCAVPIVYTLSGRYPDTNQMWSMLDLHMGPMGARSGKDGIDAMPYLMSDFTGYGPSIEGYEWEYPVLYDDYRLWPDSGGPGKFRGAAGIVKNVNLLTDASLTVRTVDRCHIPPQGFAGGKQAKGGGFVLNRGRANEEQLPTKKTNIQVKAGDKLTMFVSGGGGYGDPLTRDPQRVAADVLKGVVTVEAAARSYGVVINTQGQVDQNATQRLRRLH